MTPDPTIEDLRQKRDEMAAQAAYLEAVSFASGRDTPELTEMRRRLAQLDATIKDRSGAIAEPGARGPRWI